MRVVIAEDLVLLRDGLVRLLNAYGHEVVAAVGDGPSLVEAIVEHRPDIAIVDVRLPPDQRDEGLRAALTARERVPGTPVLVLSQYVEELYAGELLAGGEGGVGYLLKDRVADPAAFVAAVDRVAAGGMALDSEVVSQLLARRSAGDDPIAQLTARELEVLEAMAQGRSNAAIAEELTVTLSAVEKHCRAIFDKLGLEASPSENRRVLAVLAYLRRSG